MFKWSKCYCTPLSDCQSQQSPDWIQSHVMWDQQPAAGDRDKSALEIHNTRASCMGTLKLGNPCLRQKLEYHLMGKSRHRFSNSISSHPHLTPMAQMVFGVQVWYFLLSNIHKIQTFQISLSWHLESLKYDRELFVRKEWRRWRFS